MNKTRETKEYTTKGGHKIVIKTYLTGRESNEIQKILLRDVTMEIKGKQQDISGFQASNITELNNKTIEMMVVSIDGISDGVIDTILDLPNSEYIEITEMINEITEAKKKD